MRSNNASTNTTFSRPLPTCLVGLTPVVSGAREYQGDKETYGGGEDGRKFNKQPRHRRRELPVDPRAWRC